MKKFLLSITLVLSFVLSAAMMSCVISDEEFIENAVNAVENLQSFETENIVSMEQKSVESGNISSIREIKSNITYFASPYKLKMVLSETHKEGEAAADSSAPWEGIVLDEIYAAEKDGKISRYNKDAGEDGEMNTSDDEWKTIELERSYYDENLNYDKMIEDMTFYLKNFSGIKRAGEEKINGYNTVKFIMSFTGGSLEEAFRIAGVFGSEEFTGKLTEEFSVFDISFWIDEKSYNVVKYSADISEPYRKSIEYALEAAVNRVNAVNEISKYVTETTLSNINQAEDFEIPQEALNAAK